MPLADAAGARIWYETAGAGTPLLLIAGFGSNTTVYWANMPALARRFRVIAMDPRGSGRSDVPAGPYTMAMLADDAAAVLDAAGAPTAHVLGTSFGGMIAQHVALRHPARVRRLALGCTTPGGAAHVLPPPDRIARFLAAAEIADPAEAVRSLYPLHYSDAFSAAHDAEIVERARATAALRSTAEGRAGQLAAVQAHDTLAELPRITAPTLVLHGSDDGIVPAENGRILASVIAGARLRMYEGARHLFFVECAEAVNAELAAFFTGDGASPK
ncbi:MAG TPA: alpha/beta hydrolase [Steroidobacteraceae bacterium]|nr:alpha/beta hydrolase [Steroidobacteraceae bacterium]